MNILNGLKIDISYLPEIHWKRDIQYFEGPLLSEYEDKNGNKYLSHWCDCNSTSERWLLFNTDKRSLLQLVSGLQTLYQVIKNSSDSNYFIVDKNSEGSAVSVRLTKFEDIDTSYLPEESAKIDPELFIDKKKDTFSVLIDKKWSADEIAKLPRKFIDAFTLIKKYSMPNKDGSSQLSNHPWKGGFSSYQFYSELKATFPSLPRVIAIQYNSPGYIELSLDKETAKLVKLNVEEYLKHKKDMDSTFTKLTKYLKDEELNKGDFIPTLTKAQESKLNSLTENLFKEYKQPTWPWIKNITPDMFRSTKLAMSYHRRIKDIARFIEDGRVELAEF